MVIDDRGIIKEILDALPSAVCIVDEDVRIQEYNATAAELITAAKNAVLQQRAGDILHCINASAIMGGCSRSPACKSCTIRNSVTDAFRENRIIRRRGKMQLIPPKKCIELQILLTISPFSLQGTRYALMMIEDFDQITKLCRMLLVCHACGKMLDGDTSLDWSDASASTNDDINCSKSYCPDCLRKKIEKSKLSTARKPERRS